MTEVSPIPEGMRTITPHLVLGDAAAAIDFYAKAFGAAEQFRHEVPGGGGIMHATIKIGDSIIYLADLMSDDSTMKDPLKIGGSTVTLHLYVEDTDAAFTKAVEAGATALMPPADMFWGDRYAMVSDPFGHNWAIATHVKDVTPEESAKAAEAFFAQVSA